MRHCGVTQRGTVSYGGHAGVVLQYTLLSLTYVSMSHFPTDVIPEALPLVF